MRERSSTRLSCRSPKKKNRCDQRSLKHYKRCKPAISVALRVRAFPCLMTRPEFASSMFFVSQAEARHAFPHNFPDSMTDLRKRQLARRHPCGKRRWAQISGSRPSVDILAGITIAHTRKTWPVMLRFNLESRHCW